MKFAIIDLGTNSARLFIYELNNNDDWVQVYKERQMVRLGDDLFLSGTLSSEAFERAVKAFQYFKSIIDKHEIQKIKVVATSALREAQDSQRLVSEIKKLTDLDIDIISGEQEAAYIVQGVLKLEKEVTGNLVFVDIGGGSTEIGICEDKTISALKSLQLGAGRGQQLYLKQVPPISNGVRNLKEQAQSLLKRNFSYGELKQVDYAIGTSGSIRALGRIAQERGESVPDHAPNINIDGTAIDFNFLERLVIEMQSLEIKDLRALPHLEERRADLILSASIVLFEVMKYFSIPYILPSKSSLVNGVLSEIDKQ